MREQHDFRGYLAIKHLAKSLKRRIPDLLALHRKNDPFYAGSPGQREKAAWFATLWERFGYTTGVHLRRVHYRIVVHENPILKVGGFTVRKYRKRLELPL